MGILKNGDRAEGYGIISPYTYKYFWNVSDAYVCPYQHHLEWLIDELVDDKNDWAEMYGNCKDKLDSTEIVLQNTKSGFNCLFEKHQSLKKDFTKEKNDMLKKLKDQEKKFDLERKEFDNYKLRDKTTADKMEDSSDDAKPSKHEKSSSASSSKKEASLKKKKKALV